MRIMTVDECKRWIASLPKEISACYVLWNRLDEMPVYVGTARSPSRLRSHLQKDDCREGNLGKLIINKPFYDYVMRQPIGWLGVSAMLCDSDGQARDVERNLIAEFGMRPAGSLFNRRISG